MEDNVRKIKDRLDIVDVVSGYVKIQKAGVNWKGRCPFHNEKTPSFFVTPERQIWHCFGCAKGGDMFEFVKEIEGVEFPEALRILAAKAGIELESFDKLRTGDYVTRDAKTKLYEICELANKFFEKQFQSTAGKKAYEYLIDRGLTAATIKDFRLGFAPNDWEALSDFLKIKGYSDKEIIETGLAIKRDVTKGRGEGIYDRFRSRIIFPIFDISGQTVGFTGRVFELGGSMAPTPAEGGVGVPTYQLDKSDNVGAKYINTPGTLIYDKSRILYGLSKAKLEIKRADRCILVEGNMDTLMSYQAGVKNVVATSGTALTPHHLRLLQRYTKDLGFCFDTDQAGAAATRRGIGLALAGQFNIRVLELADRECKDPADYVKRYGAGWIDAVSSAKPVIDYYFDRARRAYDPTSAESKKSIIAAVAPFVKRLSSKVERSHWIAQLSALLRTPEDAISSDVMSFKDPVLDLPDGGRDDRNGASVSDAGSKEIVSGPAVPRDLPDIVNEAFLSVVLRDPSLFREELPSVPYELLHPRTAETLRRISALLARAKDPDGPDTFLFADLAAGYSESEALPLEFANLRSQELWKGFSDDQLKAEFQTLLNAVRKRALSTRLTELQFDVKEAENAKDTVKLENLSREFQELVVQLAGLNISNVQKETQIRQSADEEKDTQKEVRQPPDKKTPQAARPDEPFGRESI